MATRDCCRPTIRSEEARYAYHRISPDRRSRFISQAKKRSAFGAATVVVGKAKLAEQRGIAPLGFYARHGRGGLFVSLGKWASAPSSRCKRSTVATGWGLRTE